MGWVILGMAVWVVCLEPPHDLFNADWVGWTTKDVALILAAVISLTALEHFGWGIALHEIEAQSGTPVRSLYRNTGIVAANVLAILVAVVVFGMIEHGQGWNAVGLHRVSGGWTIAAVIVGLLCVILPILVFLAIERWRGRSVSNTQNEFLLPTEESIQAVADASRQFPWPGILGMVLLVGIAVPFCEELLFRGVLFSWLAKHLGLGLGVLLSSVVFGLAHLRSGRVVAGFASAFGVVMALTFYWSDSLWTPVIIHTIVNLTKVSLLYGVRWVSGQISQTVVPQEMEA
jgi:membrane protease YdiL (CAAX protease family)